MRFYPNLSYWEQDLSRCRHVFKGAEGAWRFRGKHMAASSTFDEGRED